MNQNPEHHSVRRIVLPSGRSIEVVRFHDREQVDRLEEKLDDGLAEMLADLQRLTQANMAEDIDRFSSALHADHILPEDF